MDFLHEVALHTEGVAGLQRRDTLKGNVDDATAGGAVKMSMGEGVAVHVDVVVIDGEERDGSVPGQHIHSVVNRGAGEARHLIGEVGEYGIYGGMRAVRHEIFHDCDAGTRHAHSEPMQMVGGGGFVGLGRAGLELMRAELGVGGRKCRGGSVHLGEYQICGRLGLVFWVQN